MQPLFPRRLPLRLALTALMASVAPLGYAAEAEPAETSQLDAPLFYQLLIGELEVRQGQAGTAYAVLLDAARRTREEGLFQRAMDIALRAQAGNEALAAANAWRAAHPQSLEAVRAQVRILLALNRLQALAEPLKQLIQLTPEADRGAAIAGLPRLVRGHPQPREALQLMQAVLIPLADQPATRTPAQLALARALFQVGQAPAALALARDVAQRQPQAPGPALLALDMLADEPQAQSLVADYLAQPAAEVWVRLAYAQWLSSRQQQGAALAELRRAVQSQPDMAQAWFSLGALALEVGEKAEAEEALKRYLLLQVPSAAATTATTTAASPSAAPTPSEIPTPTPTADAPRASSEDEDDPSAGPDANAKAQTSARLMLSQLATDRGDFEAALRWLQPLEGQLRPLDLQSRRAMVLARQGKLDPARALIRGTAVEGPRGELEKVLAEAQVMRSVDRWREARDVLSRALPRYSEEPDLLYELALTLERLGRHEEMERHLRRIIELKPDHHHAHNALGYSYAERGIRLDEAQRLVARALELAPGDPFITDSLAWVAFRQGQLERAEELLRTAYGSRSDTEIGTHLAEVLWARGQREQARQIWRELRKRDSRNKLLQDTLQRLKVEL